MKSLTIILALFLSYSLFAQIPEKAEDISPLLIGETIPNANLWDANRTEVSLHKVIKEKPTVLVFYRGGWCPYCNQQLAALGESEQEIVDLGYQIVAVSPDHVESLKPTIDTEGLNYQVYADPQAKLIQEIGIGFQTPSMAKMYIAKKTKLDATEILPVPTVMILNTKGEILFEYINPNYKVRLSSELLMASLRVLKSEM